MLYSFDCKECEGKGKVREHPNFITGSIKPPWDPCPHCKGSGGFNLGVEKPCENCPSPDELPEPRDYGCPVDGGQCDVWTPMTEDEVAELLTLDPIFKVLHSGWYTIIQKRHDSGNCITYKGQPVKLLPREG